MRMTKLRYLTAVSLVFLLLLSLWGCTGAPAGNTTGKPTDYTALYNLIENKMSGLEYPEYYGGAFTDKETGKLVILAVDLAKAKENLQTVLENFDPDAYVFKACAVSYRELTAIHQKVCDSRQSLEAQQISIPAVAIDVINGQVTVGVLSLNEEKAQAIRAMIGSEYLSLYDSPGVTLD